MAREADRAAGAVSGAPVEGTDAPGTGATPQNGTNGATKEEPGKGPLTLVLLAPFALGAAAGWWGGLTGADSAVVSAVIPAVLTGGGGALLAIRMRRDEYRWRPEFLLISAGVVALSLGLVAGMHGALWYKEAAEERKRKRVRVLEQQEIVTHIDFRTKTLRKCASARQWLNTELAKYGHEPLPPGALCDPALFVLPPPPQ